MAGSGLSPTKVPHQCGWCSSIFYPKRVDRLTFCSRECAFAHKSAHRASPEELRQRIKARADAAKVDYPERRCACGNSFKPKAINQRRCSAGCNPTPLAQCVVCGVTYEKRKYDHGHCSLECRAKWRKEEKRRRSVSSGDRAAARLARKLKLRGVTVETVNPLKVLHRDKWRCQLCGASTPQRLRGTYDDRAPEVDHIIPLSKGGEHSYRNTQCACRKCNIAKAGEIKGQMRLFG